MKHRRDPAAGRGSGRLFKNKQITFAVSLPRPELRDLQTLRPYQQNARTHSKRQIEHCSIDRTLRIYQSGLDRRVRRDHRRTLRIEHLSDAEKRAYILADNKLAEKAGWDREILAIEL